MASATRPPWLPQGQTGALRVVRYADLRLRLGDRVFSGRDGRRNAVSRLFAGRPVAAHRVLGGCRDPLDGVRTRPSEQSSNRPVEYRRGGCRGSGSEPVLAAKRLPLVGYRLSFGVELGSVISLRHGDL